MDTLLSAGLSNAVAALALALVVATAALVCRRPALLHALWLIVLIKLVTPPPLQKRARRLAERLGLRRCPDVWLLPGRVAPLLWAAGGRPRVFLPDGLLDPMTPEQRDALLVHELAHFKRRDHWVRWLEF